MPHNNSNTFQLTSVSLESGDNNSRRATSHKHNNTSTSATSEMGLLLQRRRETELKMVQLRQAILALEEDAYVVGVVAPDREVSKESLEMMGTIKTLLGGMEIKRDEITHEIACQRMKKHDDAEMKQIALEDKLRVEQEIAMQKAIHHAEEEKKVFVLERAAKNLKHQDTVEKIREKLQVNAAMHFSQLQKTILEEEARAKEKQREREIAKSDRLERYWQKDQERTARRVALEERKEADFERLLSGATSTTTRMTLTVPPRPNTTSGTRRRSASTSPTKQFRGGEGAEVGNVRNGTSQLPPRAGTSLERIHPTKRATQHQAAPVPSSYKSRRKEGDVGVAEHKKHRRGHELGEELDREDERHLKNAKEEYERVRTKFVDKNAQRENDAAENLDNIRQRKLNNIEAMYARRHDAEERIETLRRLQQTQLDRSAQERSERAAEVKQRSAKRKVDNRWLKRAQALVSAATTDETN